MGLPEAGNSFKMPRSLSTFCPVVGPSRHLLWLHKGGRCRGEPDIDEDL